MTAFFTGFWTWAHEHWLLAAFLLFSVLKTFRVIVKSIARIWWRPLPGAPRDEDLEAEPPPVALNTGTDTVVPDRQPATVQVQVEPRRERREPRRVPERPRRSMWDRLMED